MVPLSAVVSDVRPGFSGVSLVTALPQADGRYLLMTGRHLLGQWRASGEDTIPVTVLPAAMDQQALIAADLADRTITDVLRAVSVMRTAGLAAATFAPALGLSQADGLRLMAFLSKHPDVAARALKLGLTVSHIRVLAPLPPSSVHLAVKALELRRRSSRELQRIVASATSVAPSVELASASTQLRDALHVNVSIREKVGAGYLVSVPWSDVNVLTGILESLGKAPMDDSRQRPLARELVFHLQSVDEFQALFGHLMDSE